MDRKTILLIAALCFVGALHAQDIEEDVENDVVEGIVFLDSEVEALCLDNWDDDGDGVLSMEEAAAVTTLGSVFRENEGIVHFEELQYFTGLTTIDDYAFYKSSIETVAFPPSVTSIGKYAFSQSNISGELHVPGTVKDIKDFSFYTCKRLTGIVLEEGVETVGWHSFSGPLATLLLPASLTFMKSMAVDPFVNAEPSSGLFVPDGDLWVFSRSEIPAAINDFAFYYMFGECQLIVPYGSVEAYKAVDGWSSFRNYYELGDVNADGRIVFQDVSLLRQFVDGEDVTLKNYYLGDVNMDGVVNEDDITVLTELCDSVYGDIPTAVQIAESTTRTSAVYSLDGRLVASDKSMLSTLPDGIYICQGRKIVVRN